MALIGNHTYAIMAAETIGGPRANTKSGAHTISIECVRGVWGHAPRKF